MDLQGLEVFGRPLADYARIAAIAAIAAATVLLRLVIVRVSRRIGPGRDWALDDARRRKRELSSRALRGLAIPAVYLGAALAASSILRIEGAAQKVVRDILIGAMVLFAGRLFTSIMGLYAEAIAVRERDPERVKNIRPIAGFLKAVFWILAVLFYLDNVGIDTSSVLAGLGIGGIAVALAAQSVLGDLFGYFIIRFDRPFEPGDYVSFDDYSGTIDRIGFKTTKIRALSGEQIVVANSALTASRIRNFKRMEKRRVAFAVGVVYETPREDLESIPRILRDAIEAQQMVEFDRSHLKGIGPSGLDFESVYYVTVPDYLAFMDAQQAIVLRILEDFRARGIRLAYPTSTVYVGADARRA